MVELDHSFSTDKPIDESWQAILDLERLVPCVEGGKVIEKTGDDSVKAEIRVKMGAMSLTYAGTVSVIEQDPEAHRAVMQVKSRETRGQGHANADVTFTLSDGGGTIHTAAQITGKAASMGEGVMVSVLDALIKNFTSKLANMSAVWPGSRCDTSSRARFRPTAAQPSSSSRADRCSQATARMTTSAWNAGMCWRSRCRPST
jgi:carbon monoxide dehydrogenase subunit G